jgi:hypothetical protein
MKLSVNISKYMWIFLIVFLEKKTIAFVTMYQIWNNAINMFEYMWDKLGKLKVFSDFIL